jgi:hypothetical protein
LARPLVFFFTLFLLFTKQGSALGAVTIALSPTPSTILPISTTRQFSATVSGTTNTTVAWSLTPPPGVDPSIIGSIDTTEKYTAPPNPLRNFASLTVTATSVADPTVSASTAVTVRYPIPWPTALTPNPLPFGPFTLTVTGSRFVSGAQVLWNGQPLTTNYISSTQLTATGTASQVGSVNITVANPGPSAVSSALSLTVSSNLTVTVSPTSISLATNGTQQFQVTVTDSSNQNVTWGIVGDSSHGSITSTGLYTAPATLPLNGIATVYAIAQADGFTQGSATVSIQDPQAITNGRFLEQTTFGPTSTLTAHLKQVGMSGFLQEQFSTAESPWPSVATATRADAIDAFFANAYAGQDQLRQRVLYALSEIFVVALNKNTNGNEIVPWLQVLSRNAFGNYRTLLKEITLDASMGKYLDLANSGVMGGAANENYPREVMQLFSLGVSLLNIDGSVQTDANGVAIPTYTQIDVQQLAKALTGWTYSNSTNTTGSGGNFNYYQVR